MAAAPSGELVSVGIGKETTPGVAATSTVFLIPSSSQFAGTNETMPRPGARARVGQTEEMIGLFTGTGTMNVEFDPDTAGAILLLTCGAESIAANAANPSALAVTTTNAGGATPIGWGPMTPTAMTNIVKGQSLTVDTAGQVETVVVKAISSTQFWAYFTKTHANGVSISNAAVVLAQDHTFTLASPRKTFTTQINEIVAARNCLGTQMSKLSLKLTPQAILEAAMSCEYNSEAHVGSVTSPSYSVLNALSFITAGSGVTMNGVAIDSSVQGFGFDIDLGLIKTYPKYGNGRLRQCPLPETQTIAAATMDLAFETETMRQQFWGIPGATGPQSNVLSAPFVFTLNSDDMVNTAVPYSLKVIIPRGRITAGPVKHTAKDYLKQSVSIKCAESVNGAGDDIKFILTNASSAASF